MRQRKEPVEASFTRLSLVFPKLILFSLFIFFSGLAGYSSISMAANAELTEVEKVALMEEHYTAAIRSHDALIQGNLESLRKQLAKIAEQKLPTGAPKSWTDHHIALQRVARKGERVSTLDEAASVMAEVGEACGTCHATLEVGKIYFWPEEPKGNDELEKAMRTHQWATERLWEGITGPYEEAWNRGASILANVRLFGEEGGSVKTVLLKLEAELRALGRNAKAATRLHERASIYGHLLKTCAACHQEAGVTIKPAKEVPPWQK